MSFCMTCKKKICACPPAKDAPRNGGHGIGFTIGFTCDVCGKLTIKGSSHNCTPSQPPPNPYRKPCGFPVLDVYRVLELFEVTDPCMQHAVKKLLFAGKRRGGKTAEKDVAEAIETMRRWQEMRAEEATKGGA